MTGFKRAVALLLVFLYLLLGDSAVLAVDLSQADCSAAAYSSTYAFSRHEVLLEKEIPWEKVWKNKDEEIARKFTEAKQWLNERLPDMGKVFSESLAKWKAAAQKMVESLIEKINEFRWKYQTLV